MYLMNKLLEHDALSLCLEKLSIKKKNYANGGSVWFTENNLQKNILRKITYRKIFYGK